MDILRERSTWIGVVSLLALVCGWTVLPGQIEIIASSIATLAGVALVWMRERK